MFVFFVTVSIAHKTCENLRIWEPIFFFFQISSSNEICKLPLFALIAPKYRIEICLGTYTTNLSMEECAKPVACKTCGRSVSWL